MKIIGHIVFLFLLTLSSSMLAASEKVEWKPIGLSGGGAMFTPAISPIDPKLMMLNCDMSAAYLSSDGGRKWQMIPYSQLRGNTRCRPAFHPVNKKIIYAASGWSGKLKVTHDGGKTWKNTGDIDERLMGEIAIDPGNPDLMLIGAGDSVWFSENAGKNWKKCSGPGGKPLGFHFDQTSSLKERICFAATSDGIWRSNDGGKSWVQKTQGLPWKSFYSFVGGSNKKKVVLYCSIESRNENGKFAGGVYRSTDRGESWQSAMGEGINKEIKKSDVWADGDVAQFKYLLTTNIKPDTIYAFNTSTGFNPPNHNAVFRSDDGGKKWRATFYSDPRFKDYNVEYNWRTATLWQNFQGVGNGAAVSAGDPEKLFFVDSMMCYISHDGGKQWFNGVSRPANRLEKMDPITG